MKFIRFFHSFFVLILAPLLTLLVSVATLIWVGVFRRSADTMHSLVRYWGKIICRLSGVSVRMEGAEKLNPDRPYIFAANHQSQFDIIALQGYLEFNYRWLAKKELFKVPVWGTAMKLAGYISVDRAHSRQALRSLDAAARRIAEGTSVVIFPEGTRSKDGRLQPFKSGGMVLAIKSGVPLVPVAISGTHEILPKGSITLRPGNITIRIGHPIETKDYKTNQRHELAERLQKEVEGLLSERPAPIS